MKTMKQILTLLALALLSTLNLQPSTCFAQGTAFTYQGRLNSGGSPASGTYNLTFSLFNTNTSGVAVAGPVTNTAVIVTNGLFTVTIDFGPGVFIGQTNWLQIGVATNGASAFTTLVPRQQLTPTPYAIYAESAGDAAVATTAGSVPASGIGAGTANISITGNAGTATGAAYAALAAMAYTAITATTATNLGGLNASSFWQLGGNNVAAGQFLGSTNNQPLQLWVNGARVLRLEPVGTSAYLGNGTNTGAPNVIGGSPVNYVASSMVGAVIGGGGATNYGGASYTNSVSADLSFLGGGGPNSIQPLAPYSVLGGGYNNSIQTAARYSFLGGGWSNSIQQYAYYSFLGGGWSNSIQQWTYYSFLGGGANNTASADYSTVPGGLANVAAGIYSFAAGQQAHANHQGAFVWADSQNAPFASTANNQFAVRAAGGAVFATSGAGMTLDGQPVLTPNVNPNTSLFFGSNARQMLNLFGTAYGIGVQTGTLFFRVENSSGYGDFCWFRGGTCNNGQDNPGGGVEQMRLDHLGNLYVFNGNVTANGVQLTSDRNAKENFAVLDRQAVLAKVAALPVTAWNFKSEAGVRHLGPMAQDFYAAFGLGADDKHIAVVDESGVALAAIQGLNQKLEDTVKQKDAEIQALAQRLAALEKLVKLPVNPSR